MGSCSLRRICGGEGPQMSPALQLQLGWKQQLDTGGAQDNDGGYTSEVIYSSSGEDHDFGDKKSACEELVEEENASEQGELRPVQSCEPKGFIP